MAYSDSYSDTYDSDPISVTATRATSWQFYRQITASIATSWDVGASGAVTANHLTTGSDTSNADTVTTASITPGANRLVLAWVVTTAGSSPSPTPSLTGNGLTWTAVTSTTAGARTMWLFRAMGASPSTGVVTITQSPTGTSTSVLWSIVEFVGVDTSGTGGSGAIVQSIVATATATALPATFTGTVVSGNSTAFGAYGPLNETFTASETKLGESQQTAPTTTIASEWAATAAQTMTLSTATSNQKRGIAVELLAGVAPGASKTLTGSITASGPYVKVPNKRPTGAVVSSGTVSRGVTHLLAGTVTAAGVKLARKLFTFPGSITATGFLQRGYPRTMTGSLTAGPGAVTRGPRKVPAGAVASTSVTRRSVILKFASGVTPAGGAPVKVLARLVAGSTSGSGVIIKMAGRVRSMGGSVTATAATKLRSTLFRAGSLRPSPGAIRRTPQLRPGGVITLVGTALQGFYQRIFGRSGTATVTMLPVATADLSVFLRHRAAATVYTVADALLDGADARTATGAPARPVTTPDPPTNVTVTAGNQQVIVSFTPPAKDGGSPITSYTATASTGQLATDVTSPITVAGLVNGVQVAFIVVATNAVGDSIPSAVSALIAPVAGKPEPPTSVVASPGNGQISVSFVAPTNNGGSPITGYVVNVSTGQTVSGSSSPILVTGLTNGVGVWATVSTVTAAGTSAPSTRTATVTPSAVPSAPVIGTATASAGQATVPWTAPASTGGSPITGYTVTTYLGVTNTVFKTTTAAASATNVSVSGLTNGTTYSFTVHAANSAGVSPESARSNTVTPTSAMITTRTASITASSTSSTQVTLTRPSGAVTGDVLVATFSTNNGAQVSSPPSGWTLIGTATVPSQVAVHAYWHVAAAGDPSSWTWNLSSNGVSSGGVQAYTGVNTTTPIDTVHTAVDTSGSATSIQASITPTSGNGMLVGTVGTDSYAVDTTPPAGWVTDYDLTVSGAKNNSQSHITYTTAAAGTYRWTYSSGRAVGLVLFALRHS